MTERQMNFERMAVQNQPSIHESLERVINLSSSLKGARLLCAEISPTLSVELTDDIMQIIDDESAVSLDLGEMHKRLISLAAEYVEIVQNQSSIEAGIAETEEVKADAYSQLRAATDKEMELMDQVASENDEKHRQILHSQCETLAIQRDIYASKFRQACEELFALQQQLDHEQKQRGPKIVFLNEQLSQYNVLIDEYKEQIEDVTGTLERLSSAVSSVKSSNHKWSSRRRSLYPALEYAPIVDEDLPSDENSELFVPDASPAHHHDADIGRSVPSTQILLEPDNLADPTNISSSDSYRSIPVNFENKTQKRLPVSLSTLLEQAPKISIRN